MARVKPQHSWKSSRNQRDRVVLCLLKRSYHRKYIAPIFNNVFKKILAREGLPNGLDNEALDAQFQTMKWPGAPGHEVYTIIHDASSEVLQRRYNEELDDIKSTIKTLKLGITFKTGILSRHASNNVTRHRAARRRPPSISPAIHSDSGSSTDMEMPVRPSLQHFAYQSLYSANHMTRPQSSPRNVRGNPSDTQVIVPAALKTNIDCDGATGPQHPVLLFRATAHINHFQSRRFERVGNRLPQPYAFGTPEFKDIVWPHLERDKSYLSPFISLAQNPHNAVCRIETSRSEDVDKKMFLAIFVFNDLQSDSRKRYGDNGGPYLVRSLFSTHEISDLPNGYRGSGEWLMYGSINCEPIAILDSAQAIKLAKALRHFKAGQADALLDASESLRNVPLSWRQTVAYCFLAHYCNRQHLPQPGSRPFKLLLQVIVDGTPASLGKLIRYCARTASEGFEDGWTTNPHTKDGRMDDSENDNVQYGSLKTLQSAITSKVNARISQRAVNPVGTLNSLAPKDNRSQTRGQAVTAGRPSPLWSPDSDVPSANASRQTHTQQPDEDWTMVDDELGVSYFTGSSWAPRGGLPPFNQLHDSQEVVQSIEHDPNMDSFVAELLASATKPSQFDTTERLIRDTLARPAMVSRSKRVSQSISSCTHIPDHPSLTVEMSADTRGSRTTKAPVLPPGRAPKRSKDLNSDDEDEDFIIVGSGRRQRMRFPIRNLSVQQAPVPENTAESLESDDEQYFSAFEML